MHCSHPPELSDAQLLAYIDAPDAPAHAIPHSEVRAHLAQCAACAKRMERLAATQQRLLVSLFRVDCPVANELGDYQLGLLAAERMQWVRQHLAICPHCAQEMRDLQGFLAAVALPVQPSALQQLAGNVKRWVARLVSEVQAGQGSLGGGEMGGGTLALAGLRGEPGKQWLYEVNDVQIILEVQAEPQPPHLKQILGLLLGTEPSALFDAQLLRNDELIASSPVDELGNFVLANLASGDYQLSLIDSASQIQIWVEAITI